MWLLSARAIEVLMRKCGWNGQGFASGLPKFYELYADMGPCLGSQPRRHDPEIATLSSAVLPLPEARFYHFGTSRQMIESVSALQNASLDQTRHPSSALKPHPDIYVLNSDFLFTQRSPENHDIWVENCALPPNLALTNRNVLTGIPRADWDFAIEPGVCLDFAPLGETEFCVRAYGFDDPFKGALVEATYFGQPFGEWLKRRGLNFEAAALDARMDIQQAPIFPVLPEDHLDPVFIRWLFAVDPGDRPDCRTRWQNAPRLSAYAISERINLRKLYTQRRALAAKATPRLFANRAVNAFNQIDLAHAAELFAESGADVPSARNGDSPLQIIHEEMFSGAVERSRGTGGETPHETRAFGILRDTLVAAASKRPAAPRRNLLEDQIVWGRSPARLDLAGGWTDTPPYCIKFGGAVVNVAVNLNGQPPVQVFARSIERREIVIRSIDLGAETRVRTLAELREYDRVGGEFSLAKGALALAGFDPHFAGRENSCSLADILEDFGGGLEISLLAAAPKGSGLGTSSILAATLLGTLSEACGLGWELDDIFHRTLILEQLLTTGGGWQDQAGGIYRGLKMVETAPGLEQRPLLRWLPDNLLGPAYANQTILLYYTGITRVAKGILREIVRGMFLNRQKHLHLLDRIECQAHHAFEAIQRDSWPDLCASVRESWELNQALDAGTNPPGVAAILDKIGDYLSAVKLLGAGGGGYLLMFAKDLEAAVRLRAKLAAEP
ncbi:MAG TPA: bifunctional fucokinase/fucose-1-phosphate guanylyltransferase, partial [Chthoniobacterales bacterium]